MAKHSSQACLSGPSPGEAQPQQCRQQCASLTGRQANACPQLGLLPRAGNTGVPQCSVY